MKLYLLTLAPLVTTLHPHAVQPQTYVETDSKVGISPDVPGVSEVTCEPGDRPLSGGCLWAEESAGHLYNGPLVDDDGAFIGWACIGLPDDHYPRKALVVCEK